MYLAINNREKNKDLSKGLFSSNIKKKKQKNSEETMQVW